MMKEYQVRIEFTGEYEAIVRAWDEKSAKEMILMDLLSSDIDDCDIKKPVKFTVKEID